MSTIKDRKKTNSIIPGLLLRKILWKEASGLRMSSTILHNSLPSPCIICCLLYKSGKMLIACDCEHDGKSFAMNNHPNNQSNFFFFKGETLFLY